MTQIPIDTPGSAGGAYGATATSVRALALDTAAEGVRPGQRAPRVSDARLLEWVSEAAAIVSTRVRRAAQLPATPIVDKEWVLSQEAVTAECRHLVELYAAAMLQDVTHPERARADTGPGSPLLERFWRLLVDLVATIDGAIGEGDAAEDGGPGMSPGGMPAAYFPAPMIRLGAGF